MKSRGFDAISSIQQTVIRELKSIPEAFSWAFDLLYERCEHCIKARGDFIE
jgi:hypothetical protein